MLDVVLSNTYTSAAVQQRIALLKEFLEHVFYGADPGGQPTLERFDAFVKEHGVELVHADAVREWGNALFARVTAGTFYAELNALLNELKSVPVLTLYTAVKFPVPEMARMAQQLRDHLGKTILLDDHVDPQLAVGCAFVWNGIYHDYSWSFFISRKREELATLVRRYGER